MLAHLSSTSPALQAALVKPIAEKLNTFYQLRYRALTSPARIPDPAQADQRATALPTLLWPGWALRLMPTEGFDFLRYRFALAMMLTVASTGVDSYRTAQELLGLHSVHASRFPSFIARLREHGALEPAADAVCQLARKLDEHGALSITPAGGGCAASPRPSSTSPAGAASGISSPTQPPGRTAATSTMLTCPPPRCRTTSPGFA
jgi:hypothetical protein